MTRLRARVRDESGQVLVFFAIILTGLVGMTALVVDVGSWYQADRKLQTAADAAALAAAQELPNESNARNIAHVYAATNYAGAPAPTVTFPEFSVDVVARADTPGIFAPVLNSAFEVVTVRAHARAQVQTPILENVAPVTINENDACIVSDPDCFGETVTIDFTNSHIGSSMHGLINLECYSDSSSGCGSGGAGGDDLRDWIKFGYSGALPANKWYGTKTGTTVGPVKQGLDYAAARGLALFFPVWDEADAGSRSFHIIGWAGFVIDSNGVDWGSNDKKLTGHFVRFDREDLQYTGGTPGGVDFGVPLLIVLTQ